MNGTFYYTEHLNLDAFPDMNKALPAPRRIRPLTGQVLIELDEPKRFADLGELLMLPQRTRSAEEVQASHRKPEKPPPLQGRVAAIGYWPKLRNGLSLMPEFGIGSKVIVRHNAGLPMQRNIGERFRMCLVEEVLAVVS